MPALGNVAVIFSRPPMAFTKSWGVLTYMSVRRSIFETAGLTFFPGGLGHSCVSCKGEHYRVVGQLEQFLFNTRLS